MLVLSRKEDESLKINDDIEIKILKIKGNQVKLGINAPTNFRIERIELTKDDQNE